MNEYFIKKYIKCERCEGTGMIPDVFDYYKFYKRAKDRKVSCPDCEQGYKKVFLKEVT